LLNCSSSQVTGGNSTIPPRSSTKHEAPSQQEAESGHLFVESGGAETRQPTRRRQQAGNSLEFSIFPVFLHCLTIKRDPSPGFLASRTPLVQAPLHPPPTLIRLVVDWTADSACSLIIVLGRDQAQLYGPSPGQIPNIPTPISPHSTTFNRFKPTISLQIAPKNKKARSDPTQTSSAPRGHPFFGKPPPRSAILSPPTSAPLPALGRRALRPLPPRCVRRIDAIRSRSSSRVVAYRRQQPSGFHRPAGRPTDQIDLFC